MVSEKSWDFTCEKSGSFNSKISTHSQTWCSVHTVRLQVTSGAIPIRKRTLSFQGSKQNKWIGTESFRWKINSGLKILPAGDTPTGWPHDAAVLPGGEETVG